MEFLNSKFIKDLKLFNEGRYNRLIEIYKKRKINQVNLTTVLEIFMYGKKYITHSEINNDIEFALEKFITKHIEVAKFQFSYDIFNLIINKYILEPDNKNELKSKVRKISIIFYTVMFRVLANTNNFSYWLNNIEFNGICTNILSNVNEKEFLQKNLIKNNLLYKIKSPVYNLAILYICGYTLTNEDFMYLYKKSKYLFSERFTKEYNNEVKAMNYGLYMTNKIFIQYNIISNTNEIQLNNTRNLYELLKLRKKEYHYDIPEELIPLYLAEDLREE